MKKNIHILPTDKPSRLGRFVDTGNLFLKVQNDLPRGENVNIYITDNSEIREGEYFLHPDNIIERASRTLDGRGLKKIILTDNPTLIDSGVQAIPNDFIDWLVQNPSCQYGGYKDIAWDQIITLKEEPKQELTSVIPQKQNTISFVQDNGAREILKLCENGDIFVKGKLAENDKEVVDALREFLKGQGFLK
jgi:hypothetical protein